MGSARFRFRLRTLLLLPLVFSLGWWWCNWPGHTFSRLLRFIDLGDVQAARDSIRLERGCYLRQRRDRRHPSMRAIPQLLPNIEAVYYCLGGNITDFVPAEPKLERPTFTDVITGRRQYATETRAFRFVVQHGSITLQFDESALISTAANGLLHLEIPVNAAAQDAHEKLTQEGMPQQQQVEALQEKPVDTYLRFPIEVERGMIFDSLGKPMSRRDQTGSRYRRPSELGPGAAFQ